MEGNKEKYFQKLDYTQVLFRHIDRINKSIDNAEFVKNIQLFDAMTKPFQSKFSNQLRKKYNAIQASGATKGVDTTQKITEYYVVLYQEIMMLLYSKNLLGVQEEIEDVIEEYE